MTADRNYYTSYFLKCFHSFFPPVSLSSLRKSHTHAQVRTQNVSLGGGGGGVAGGVPKIFFFFLKIMFLKNIF
jgi:hypothetical protein